MIILNCPDCKAAVPVPEANLKHGQVTLYCPGCKCKIRPPAEVYVQAGGNPSPVKPAIIDTKGNTTSKQEPTTVLNGRQNGNGEKGWLVVRDEKTRVQTFNLTAGKKILVGRKSISLPCDIMIETEDKKMSRNHFYINVQQVNGRWAYVLSDANSTNSTFINTTSLAKMKVKTTDEYYLKDGDIIQAGETKIVFKSSETANTSQDATRIVAAQPYGKTVLINR